MSSKRGAGVAAAILIAALVALVAVGSIVYWIGDGSTRTPAEFRARVAEAGLDIEWSNNGPRGGDGIVAADCGPVEVTVDDIDGVLWVRWNDRRERLDGTIVDTIVACAE